MAETQKRKTMTPGTRARSTRKNAGSRARSVSRRERGRWAFGQDEPRPTFDDRQQAILDVSERLFVEKGFENATLAEVAHELNVTKPAIYHYFPGKEDILRAIFQRAEVKVSTLLEQALESGHDGLEKLRQFAEGYAEHMTTLPGKCLVRTNYRSVSSEFEGWAIARVAYTDSIIRRIIAEGMRDGSIRPGDVRMATFSLFGALHWITFWHHEGAGLTPREIARQVVGCVIDGLANRAREARR